MVNNDPAVRSMDKNSESSILQRFPNEIPFNVGPCDDPCKDCGALHWRLERPKKTKSAKSVTFQTCCQRGAVKLPSDHVENDLTPLFLQKLLSNQDKESKAFRKNIRRYNNALLFASTGTKQNTSVAGKGGSWTYKITGRLTHRIGSLLPKPGVPRKFAQIFMFGDQGDNESAARSAFVGGKLDLSLLNRFQQFMYAHNPFAKLYKSAEALLQENPVKTIKIKSLAIGNQDKNRYNFPTCDQVAAVIDGDGEIGSLDRDIILQRVSGKLRRISELNTNYFSLRYPIFFMFGSHGWDEHYRNMHSRRPSKKVSNLEWFAYTLFTRKDVFSPILRGGRLFQEYCVDMYVCIENARMKFFKLNQKKIRAELYSGATDALKNDDFTIGKKIILPSSFIGGPRAMQELYHDAMALVQAFGPPSFFVTMTANPKWPEITNALLPGQTSEDRPDLVARVFRMKLAEMHYDLYKRHRLGKNLSNVDTIEFQKRGNPHDHAVLINDRKASLRTPADIDLAISAVLPDPIKSPSLYELVTTFMLHGPCHAGKSCWSGTRCKYGYPREFSSVTVITEEAYPTYRRPDDGRFYLKNGYKYTNRDVVPYSPFLLMKYQCHINCEATTGMRSIKYLYKYISKGHDRRVVQLEVENEPNDFIDGRELAAAEAVWRLYKYVLSGRYPSVTRLLLHLEGAHNVYFDDSEDLQLAIDSGKASRTTLTEFFSMCASNIKLPRSQGRTRSLLYTEMTKHYWWSKEDKLWLPRVNNTISISRLHFAGPTHGERYYLRLLLTHVRGPVSFTGIRTVNNRVFPTYRATAEELGLLMSDVHLDACLTEASAWKTGRQLRELFGLILVHSPPANPTKLWLNHLDDLSDDCEYLLALLSPHIRPTTAQLDNYALSLLRTVVSNMGKSLEDVGLPNVNQELLDDIGGETMYAEDGIATKQSSQKIVAEQLSILTPDQRRIFDYIKDCVEENEGGLLFVDGPGGCGKTFLLNFCLHYCNANDIESVAVASSGIASLLLLNGSTAHSKLGIPLNPDNTSVCSFSRNDKIGKMLLAARFLVWDVISMMHKTSIEVVDRSLQDLRSSTEPFGGLTVLFSGDFRQILPVIVHGSLLDAVRATIKYSYLWSSVRQFRLTQNIRLCGSDTGVSEFAAWLLKLGSGGFQTDPVCDIELEHVKIKRYKATAPFDRDLAYKMYFDIHGMISSQEWLKLSVYYSERAIITPLNRSVDDINKYMLDRLRSPNKQYNSVDEMDPDWTEQVSTEVLNSFNFAGFPNHNLNVKVGSVVVVLRNLNLKQGLSNGTRLLIIETADNVLRCLIITGPTAGSEVSLPRMTLHHPGDRNTPISFYRKQFPIALAFAMTINKAQGQTLARVIVALPTPVFAHGQLYVALSRCTSAANTTISIPGGQEVTTVSNVVSHQAMR